MTARALSLAVAATALVAGCASLDGLSGAGDPPPPFEVASCAAPGAPACDHGQCVDDGGVARCACEPGWTGATCAACTPGAACDRTSCEETTCPEHATCDDTSGAPTCACVAGYAESSGACAWVGVVQDPSFEDTPPGAWELTGGVTIDATAGGTKDPGVVDLLGPHCAAGSVGQTVTIPAFTSAEPLALEMWGTCGRSCTQPFSVRLDGYGVMPIAAGTSGALAQGKLCLGERAFGRALPIEIFATSCSSVQKTLLLDRFEFVPAPSCPAPGEIPNADFEGAGGWTAEGNAEVATGMGNAGSRGGRLRRTQRCGVAPKLAGMISTPLTTPARPALSFTVKGTSGRRMLVNAGGSLVGSVTGGAVFEKTSLCLPEHTRGMVEALSFVLDDDGPGSCNEPDESEFLFDDLAIAEDPTCPAAPTLIVDGGFERDDTGRYWATSKSGGNVTFPKSSGARTGAAYARVTQSSCSASTTMSTTLTLPPPAPGAGGPALEFYYKATASTGAAYVGGGQTLGPATEWTRVLICQNPRRAGFTAPLSFTARQASSCASTASLSIDDVRVLQDPTCPEE